MGQRNILSTRNILTSVVLALTLTAAAMPASAQTSTKSDDSSAPAVVHNRWTTGAPMPTAREWPFTGAIGKKIYVAGGSNDTEVLPVTEIYDTTTNTWSTGGAPMLTPRIAGASAVVNNVLYAIGGATSSSESNVVEAYDPKTNAWSTMQPMPIANDNIVAVADKDVIYVIGGYVNGQGRQSVVYAYNTSNDTWTQIASMNVAKSYPAAGLLGTTIVAAGGLENGGVTNDNEGYSVTKNKWRDLAPVPTGRQAGCYEAFKGILYYAGGAIVNGDPLSVLEAYALKTNSWTTGLASMPDGTINPGSASVAGRLYCFGGSNNGYPFQGSIYNYVQIYQP
jgi:N-acetylneuraminic acid mutarotase